ncbi:MAG: NAD(P)/FAD-dependent oxidoreductase [Thermoguttaceae bacterium]
MTETTIALPDGAMIVVVGGGPAGAFFAIHALRQARKLGKKIEILILEKKKELNFYQPALPLVARDGCNYCAGGISPRLADALRESDLSLPNDIVEGSATAVTVHGDWKSVELPIPEGRKMLSVFRGSRPRDRPGRYTNFDSYLLSRATDEGAKIITAEVRDLHYAPNRKPRIGCLLATAAGSKEETIEADFVVLAGGVNQSPGMRVQSDRLFQAIAEVLPGFRPPQVRKALICEMQAEEDLLQYMQGEVHFAQYGSRELHIEMSSLIPKGRWVTVVLLGQSVDRAEPSQYLQIVESFLQLPHIRRLLPKRAQLKPVCLCHPNMTVGVAHNALGHRIALIGDMVVSRLYKDGIFAAFVTATSLADCIFQHGIDLPSLREHYWPSVWSFHVDNRFGRLVFLLSRLVFSHPVLSRIVYQALLTERKTKPKDKRPLANVLWRIASGDDSYHRILSAMLRPATAWLVLVGGVLATLRNYLTERLFGLDWADIGRYSTGVPMEHVEEKRREIDEVLGIPPFEQPPDIERMYSIRIKAEEATILRQLGKFGDADRQYFTPRMIRVHRTAGTANEPDSTIRYDVFPRWLSFSIVLEKVVASRYVLYRVCDGFPQGGILAFDIDRKRAGGGFLTIYVAFNFPRGKNMLTRLAWYLFKRVFPGFVHEVLWNQALCKFKHLAELEDG